MPKIMKPETPSSEAIAYTIDPPANAEELASRLSATAQIHGFVGVVVVERVDERGEWFAAHTSGAASRLLGLCHLGLRVVHRAIRTKEKGNEPHHDSNRR
jgi:hypothetical protein